MDLPLGPRVHIGVITMMADAKATRTVARLADRLGFDSLWTGDHVAFPAPILEPLVQLAQAAAYSERLLLGTCVYLLPLRHPTPVAKQVATLDHLTGGRLVFGVGLGGEFPIEYEACQVPVAERGARLSESIPLLKRLWTGEPVRAQGRFYRFPEVRLLPPPLQPGGPPIWCGGRSPAALRRAGRLADGWVSYAVTPEMYRDGLEQIARAADAASRRPERFGSGHMLFTRIDARYEDALDHATEHLSRRYAMDFRRPARKYGALGRPEDVAEVIVGYADAGVRHVILDPTGPFEERDAQLERFAKEVRPLLPAQAFS